MNEQVARNECAELAAMVEARREKMRQALARKRMYRWGANLIIAIVIAYWVL